MTHTCHSCGCVFLPPETTGTLRCPACGTAQETPVHPVAPEEPPAPPLEEPSPLETPMSAQAPAADSNPWVHRHSLGVWTALVQTIQRVMTQPTDFFRALPPQPAPGAHLYFLLVAVLPQALGLVLSSTLPNVGLAGLLYEQLRHQPGADPSLLNALQRMVGRGDGTLELMGSLLALPLASLAVLYLAAGCTHLVLWMAARAARPFASTVNLYLYASTPLLFALIPGCGALLAATWATVLAVKAVRQVHGVGVGLATAAVLAWHLPVLCCCGGAAALLVALVLGVMGAALVPGAF